VSAWIHANLPQFKEWFSEDVFQRTYQDYLTEERESVTNHADDPNAPEWVKQTGDVTISSPFLVIIYLKLYQIYLEHVKYALQNYIPIYIFMESTLDKVSFVIYIKMEI
jgi:hypothetical protein